jgi:hypothetical protein
MPCGNGILKSNEWLIDKPLHCGGVTPMNIKGFLVSFLLVGGVGAAGYMTYHYFVLPSHQCEICGRPVHAAHYSSVVLKSGRHIEACCARCALHYEHNLPGQIARLQVADNASGKGIEARGAIYVEGSDVTMCTIAAESVPREPGVEYDLKFDRCLPSLVAFREESDARDFQRMHGGRVLSFAQALESVKRR